MWAESINPGRTIWFESRKGSAKVQDISSKQETDLGESWKVKVQPNIKNLVLTKEPANNVVGVFQFFRVLVKSLGAAAMIALFFWQAR